MPLRIFAETDGPPWPVPTVCEMTCDGDHWLFPAPPARFASFVTVYAAGWKETYTASGEKRWLGPCCSGKVAR